MIKEKYPYVIFIGDTYGGDVGAALYAHYNGKEVDSLIIDCYYYKNPFQYSPEV